MSLFLIISLVVAWIFISAVIVLSAAMMSSRMSRLEERAQEAPVIELVPTAEASNRIPTQPRAEVVR